MTTLAVISGMAPSHGRQTPGRPRVLVSTAAPSLGGVGAMARFAVDCLWAQGFEPVVAYYAPYSSNPKLSVPLYKLLRQRVHSVDGEAYGHEATAIGAWLPEFEFTHYAATGQWKQLMETCDAFVAVSGNILAATPFLQTGRPYLAWVATDWDGDRRDRVKVFPFVRRWLDASINSHVIRRLERRLLRNGHVLALSDYTDSMLALAAGKEISQGILPVPVDTTAFTPAASKLVPGRIGFAGRFGDPRKNIGLLLQATARLRKQNSQVDLQLAGDKPSVSLLEQATALGVLDCVRFHEQLPITGLRDMLQSLDVFVIPSHQEGLCVAALEAMACGVPVVSTRCGGPSEFVIEGETGLLVDDDPDQLAVAVGTIIGDRQLRARMSAAAVRMVDSRYSPNRAAASFNFAFASEFPQLAASRGLSAH